VKVLYIREKICKWSNWHSSEQLYKLAKAMMIYIMKKIIVNLGEQLPWQGTALKRRYCKLKITMI
jgi:hypothetical protein